MGNEEQTQRLKTLLSGPRGQRLMELLRRDGGAAMRAAGQAARQGDTDQAKRIMEPLVSDPEVQALLKAMETGMKHG